MRGFFVVISGLFGIAAAGVEIEPSGQVTPHALETRERELNSLLQANLQTSQGQRAAGSMRFFLGKGSAKDVATPSAVKQAPASAPSAEDIIPQDYWKSADRTLAQAGWSTPLPLAALANAPPATPTPMPYDAVMQQPSQPLDTKVGSAVMNALSGPVTPTPPPQQDLVDMQFIAQCPMIMFSNDLSIRAPSCNNTRGQWVDPAPLNVRNVLRWGSLPASGVRFGVDSAISGKGAALFAEVNQELTLDTYKFTLKNCLGVDRWTIEEMVYKVDNVGQVSSTMELHDVAMNGVAYFFRYLIKKPTGVVVAQSTLYRGTSMQLNFTEVVNGIPTTKLVAIVTKQGAWTGMGWRECMAPTSPRGWWIHYPVDPLAVNNTGHPSVATVQDLRVAIASTITLMAHRDEGRGTDGLNTEGGQQQTAMVAGGVLLIFIGVILAVNCCMVFRNSGLKEKLKRVLTDTEGAMLPKQPAAQREAPFHPTY